MAHLRSSSCIAAPLLLALTGCGVNGGTARMPASLPVPHIMGRAYGGQQPVVGATIQLYAAGTTGYGSAATPLITGTTVKTGSDGSFSITGAFTCPSAAEVYITATGGDPGVDIGTNSSLALIAALGPCSGLSASTFININEVTTVASVWALSSFASGINVGAPASNAAGLAQAFADVNQLVNTSTGYAPGPALPAGALAPVTQIYTIADILSSCVNSSGTGDGTTPCDLLFANTKSSSGVTPTDTITAALNMARNPAANVSTLAEMVLPAAPFQPQATPNDFTLAITYTVASHPSAMAFDAAGNLWVANQGANSVTKLTPAGATTTYTAGSMNQPCALAIDSNGNVWIANRGNNTLTELTSGGMNVAGSPFSGGGLNAPDSVAIDPLGNVWLSNSGANIVSEFASNGTPIVPNGYTASGSAGLIGVAVNAK